MFEKEYTEPKNLPLDKINIQQVSQNIIDKKDKLIQTLLQKREKIEEKYHFIVDFSNGAGVSIEKEFFEKLKNLGNQIDYLNDTPDGNFSAHLSETQDAKNYEQLIHEIQKK
jgi:phosphomannomutase